MKRVRCTGWKRKRNQMFASNLVWHSLKANLWRISYFNKHLDGSAILFICFMLIKCLWGIYGFLINKATSAIMKFSSLSRTHDFSKCEHIPTIGHGTKKPGHSCIISRGTQWLSSSYSSVVILVCKDCRPSDSTKMTSSTITCRRWCRR